MAAGMDISLTRRFPDIFLYTYYNWHSTIKNNKDWVYLITLSSFIPVCYNHGFFKVFCQTCLSFKDVFMKTDDHKQIHVHED